MQTYVSYPCQDCVLDFRVTEVKGQEENAEVMKGNFEQEDGRLS